MADPAREQITKAMMRFVAGHKASYEALTGERLTLEEYARRVWSGETYLPKAPPGEDHNDHKDTTKR